MTKGFLTIAAVLALVLLFSAAASNRVSTGTGTEAHEKRTVAQNGDMQQL